MPDVVDLAAYRRTRKRADLPPKKSVPQEDTILIRMHGNGDIDYSFQGAFKASRLLTAQTMTMVLGEVLHE